MRSTAACGANCGRKEEIREKKSKRKKKPGEQKDASLLVQYTVMVSPSRIVVFSGVFEILTDGGTDGRPKPLLETQGRILKKKIKEKKGRKIKEKKNGALLWMMGK